MDTIKLREKSFEDQKKNLMKLINPNTWAANENHTLGYLNYLHITAAELEIVKYRITKTLRILKKHDPKWGQEEEGIHKLFRLGKLELSNEIQTESKQIFGN